MVGHQRIRHAKVMPKGTLNVMAKHITKVRNKLNAGTGKPILSRHIPVTVRDMFFREKSQRSELRRSLPDYISLEDAVDEVAVPGDICPNRLHRKASYHARTGFSAVIDWAVRLDDLGFSLNGQFSLSDWGMTHSGFLKAKSNMMSKLVRRTKAAAKSTMLTLGTAIEEIFSNTSPPPADVANLIGILKKFKPSLKPLLRIHVARENSIGKSLVFTKMFDRLEAVKDDGTSTYTDIIAKLPLENWVHMAMTNAHLHTPTGVAPKTLVDKITSFLTTRVKYAPTSEDQLHYRRNGEAHLVKDYSFDAIEGLEEALTAAVTAAAEVHPALKTVISGQQQPLPAGTAPEFAALFSKHDAGALSLSISDAIVSFKRSTDAAKAAAVAAAMKRVSNHPHMASSGMRDARIAGSSAGYAVLQQLLAQGIPEQEVKVRKMF